MKRIPLTQGQFAICDDKDYYLLMNWSWYAQWAPDTQSFYAKRRSPMSNGKRETIWMHRQILGLAKGDKRQCDHRRHATLDNRRSQLRIVTNRQNSHNLKKAGTSIYPGVSWNKATEKWLAQIRIDGKVKYLGYFTSEKDAAKAYRTACKEVLT